MGNSPFSSGFGGVWSGCDKSKCEPMFMGDTGGTLPSGVKVCSVGDVALCEAISMSASGTCLSVLSTFCIGDVSVRFVVLFSPV